jgi:hypothetical protein
MVQAKIGELFSLSSGERVGVSASLDFFPIHCENGFSYTY